MVATISLLLFSGSAMKPREAVRMYRQWWHKLQSAPSLSVDIVYHEFSREGLPADHPDYKFTLKIMGKRYRSESTNDIEICNGKTVYRKDSEGKETWIKATSASTEDAIPLGLAGAIKGGTNSRFFETRYVTVNSDKFNDRPALDVGYWSDASPTQDWDVFFDPKTRMPIGSRHGFGSSGEEYRFSKFSFNAHLKPADFAIPIRSKD